MIKIKKRILSIYVFIFILTILLTGCSQNPVTGNFGPSWDMMMELPVLNSDNVFEELEVTEDFKNMGLTTTENEVESFYLIGTATEPIVSSLSIDLPELDVELKNGINENIKLDLENNQNQKITKNISFPKVIFGSRNNTIDLTVKNTGGSDIDEITVELWDKNSDRNYALTSYTFENVEIESTHQLVLNNKEIKAKDLELRVEHNQTSGSTSADILINGLKNITVKKVKDLEVSDINLPSLENTQVKIGLFDKINGYNNSAAELKTYIEKPESTNIDINITDVFLDNLAGNNQGEYYQWKNDLIELGYLKIASTAGLNEKTITYDSSDTLTVKVEMQGKAAITSNNIFYDKYKEKIIVENGDVLFTTPPMKVAISKSEISQLTENNIDHKETYFQADLNNLTGVELIGDIYIANSSINLYNTENKVNIEKIKVEKGENLIKRYLLKEIFDQVKETLTSGEIYIGMKLKAGDFSTKKGIKLEFTDATALDINSSLFVKLKVNQ